MRWPLLLLLLSTLLTSLIAVSSCSLDGRYNYASFDCAARILATNPGARSASSILHDQRDSYLRNLCSFPEQWVVIELCQDIRIDTVVLANFEFFSSTFREVEVWLAKRYPPPAADEWRLLGKWIGENVRGEQVFRIPKTEDDIYARFLKIRILSHYGNEYYCPLSVVKVFGRTMLDDFAEEEETKRAASEAKAANSDYVVLLEDAFSQPKPVKSVPVKKVRTKTMPFCPVHTHPFNSTCTWTSAAPSTNTVHALQPFQVRSSSLQRIIPLRNRMRPVFPLPTVRKTVIFKLRCPLRNPLQFPICSVEWKSVKVIQRPYIDPDRLVISDVSDFISSEDTSSSAKHRQQGKHRHENIFKSLSDRLDALERAHTKHALLLQAALQRFEMQIDQILSEMDMTDVNSRGLESYRERLQRYLVEFVEERVERLEQGMEERIRSKRNQSMFDLSFIVTIANAVLLIALLLLIMLKRPIVTRAPLVVSPPSSPLPADQAVPKRADSLERVQQTLMEASPLLLFDPETDLVDGIYSASPIQQTLLLKTNGDGKVEEGYISPSSSQDLKVPSPL